MRNYVFLSLLSLFSVNIFAAELSGRMSDDDYSKTVKVLGMQAAHHSWTAHALPNDELGLDLGIESKFISRDNIHNSGDGTGIMPKLIPVPGLWFSWDLPEEFKVSGSWAPAEFFDGITMYGAGVQYVFFRDFDSGLAASSVVEYSYVNVFDDMKANVMNLAAQISRDLISWQPYAGGGLCFAASQIKPGLEAEGVARTRITPAFHVYAGAHIDFISKMSFQADLYNAQFGLSVLLNHRF